MTGRYLIYTPLDSRRQGCRKDDRQFEACWHRFIAVCRSLHRDRLTYSLQFNLADERPHVVITASGTVRPRKQTVARSVVLPPPVATQSCRERALEVEWFLPENWERRNGHTSYWRTRHARYQELSQMPEEQLRIELEYWRELERLSREHSRTGHADEAADAEAVAA